MCCSAQVSVRLPVAWSATTWNGKRRDREQLQGTGVSVTRNGDQIILNMPGNVTFATDSSDISANFYPVLDSVALVVNEYKQTYVDILGHTDSTGRADYNQALSERRATSVARYLESHQVLGERIIMRGLGQNAPHSR